MKLIVVGRSEELTGFALAGVATVGCNSTTDATALIEQVTSAAAGAGLVLVSPWIAQHAARAIAAARRRKGPPVITVMPG